MDIGSCLSTSISMIFFGQVSAGREVNNADIEDDEACVQSNVGGTVLQYEYHVLFSCSFGMPVLYFRVFDLGRCLYACVLQRESTI